MKWLKLSMLLLIVLSSLSCEKSHSAEKGSGVLSQMRQSLGLPTLETGIDIYALADCSGPNSVFKTLVISSPTETRFEQKAEARHILGIHRPDSVWIYDFVGDTLVAVDSATITFLIDHELHMIAFYPENRFGVSVSEKDTVYYSEEARMLTFIDIKGGPIKVFYKAESWLPLGFSIQNHMGRGAEQVDVLFENWKEVEGIQVFTEARFLQGDDVYHYQFTEIGFDKLPKDAFTKNQSLILP